MKLIFSKSVTFVAVLSLTAGLLAGCGSKPSATTDDSATPVASSAGTTTAASASTPVPTIAPVQQKGPLSPADAYKSILTELAKVDSGGIPDYDAVLKTYNENIKPLAQKRDSEKGESSEPAITAAISGAKGGQLSPLVANQIIDKLIQKVYYTTVKLDLKNASAALSHKDDAKKLLADAQLFYQSSLENTVKATDGKLKTTLADTQSINFADLGKAIDAGSALQFDIDRQTFDKTMMKTFYLNLGAKDSGLVYQIEKAIAAGKDGKAEQAAAWAYFQSLSKYVSGQAKDEADFINKQLDLGTTDAKTLKGDVLNAAIVRAFAKTGAHEFEESQEAWGQNKAVTAGWEGALFVDMLYADIARLQGDNIAKELKDEITQYIDAAKNQKKDDALALFNKIEATMKETVNKSK